MKIHRRQPRSLETAGSNRDAYTSRNRAAALAGAAVLLLALSISTAGAQSATVVGETLGEEPGTSDVSMPALAPVIEVAVPAQPEPAADAAAPDQKGIEEIIITAQKRESTIQDAPFAVSALGGDDAGFRAVSGAADLQFQVPGMNVSEGSSATLISIRGVGSNVDSGATEPAVAVHIDGVYQPRPSTGPLGLNDLERVEVLKGPQGTLYGRNSTGGVVNYILKKPTDDFEGSLKAGVGNFDKRSTVGILSGPLVSGVLNGRIMAEWDEDGGYTRDLTSGQISDMRKGYGGRVALDWKPADVLDVALSVLYRHDEGGGITPRDVCLAPPNPQVELSLLVIPTTNIADPDACLQGRPHERTITRLPSGERDTLNAALTAVWSFEAFSLKSVTGYQNHEFTVAYDVDSLRRDILWIPRNNHTSNALSEELSVSGNWSDLQWLAGAYYFDGEYTPDLHVNVPPVAGGLDVFLKEVGKTKSIAGFTDLTYSITDTVRVGGGLRVLQDQKDAVQTNNYEVLNGLLPVPFSVPGVLNSCTNLPISLEYNKVTPKVTASWDVIGNATLYSNYSVGYQSGGTNFSSCDDTYEPEQNTSVELGLKSSWFGRRLLANAAVYRTQYENLQVLKIEGFAANVINAPKASIHGAELELTALLGEHLLTNLAVSLLDAQYEEFSDSDPINPDRGVQDLKGVELARSPRHTVNIGAEYSWELPSRLAHDLRLRAEWFNTADQSYRPFGDANDGQKGYSIVNTFLSLGSENKQLEIRLYGKNLGDTEYFLYKIGNSFGERFGTAGEPRRFGAELLYHF